MYNFALVRADNTIRIIVQVIRESDISKWDTMNDGEFVACGDSVTVYYTYDPETEQFTPPE